MAEDEIAAIRVVTRDVAPEEAAAALAVIRAIAAETEELITTVPHEGPSAWERTRSYRRGLLDRGPGRWRSFSG